MTAYALRSGASGPRFTGNPGDVLTLDASGEHWLAQPGATAGLTAFNHRTAPDVVPTAGDYDISQNRWSSSDGRANPGLEFGARRMGADDRGPRRRHELEHAHGPGDVSEWRRCGEPNYQRLERHRLDGEACAAGACGRDCSARYCDDTPLAGGGVVQSGLTLSVATVSNTSSGVVPAIATANGALVANSGGTAASFALISDANVAATSITLGKLAQSGASANQYPSWSGTAWVPTTPLDLQLNPANNGAVATASNGTLSMRTRARSAKRSPAPARSRRPCGARISRRISSSRRARFSQTRRRRFAQIGTNTAGSTIAAQTGNVRVFYTFLMNGRNSAFNGDITLFDWGNTANTFIVGGGTTGNGPPVVQLGSASATSMTIKCSSAITVSPGAGNYIFRPTRLDLNAGITGIQSTGGAVTYDIAVTASASATGTRATLGGQPVSGAGAFGGPVQLLPGTASGSATQSGNLEIFGTSGSVLDNSAAFVAYVKDRQSVPTAGPTNSGLWLWSDTGGLLTTMSVAGNSLRFDNLTSASATGGAATIPALAVEFMTVTRNGNTRKVALFAA